MLDKGGEPVISGRAGSQGRASGVRVFGPTVLRACIRETPHRIKD